MLSITSKITLSSMSLVKNPQSPPSTLKKNPPSWHTSNKDINIKLSRFLYWDQMRSSMMSGMTLFSMSLVRIPQCSPSTPMKDSPILETLLIKISTRNFQNRFLGVRECHSWDQSWSCPSCLWSGTIIVLQISQWRTPPSLHTINKNINMKFPG